MKWLYFSLLYFLALWLWPHCQCVLLPGWSSARGETFWIISAKCTILQLPRRFIFSILPPRLLLQSPGFGHVAASPTRADISAAPLMHCRRSFSYRRINIRPESHCATSRLIALIIFMPAYTGFIVGRVGVITASGSVIFAIFSDDFDGARIGPLFR